MWRLSVLLFALALTGCSGPVIETLSHGEPLPDRLDGAFMSYFFARAEIGASASYTKDTGLLTVSIDPAVKALPDFEHKHVLAYAHGALSTDDINVQLDNGILKSVSTTTTDQTVELAKNINALLTQAGETEKAVAKPQISLSPVSGKQPCTDGDVKVSAVKDVTYWRTPARTAEDKRQANCKIKLTVRVEPKGALELFGFPRDRGELRPRPESICDEAVCFRLTGAYTVTATATLTDVSGKIELQHKAVSLDVLAPSATDVGYVRFNRRRFVANTTTVTFTNGMISGFAAKDPSEIVGFFTLPTELLKSVTLAVKL